MERIGELDWRKASKSGNGGNCVEIGSTSEGRVAAIRDSKRPTDGYLTVTPTMLGELLTSVRNGDLDIRLALLS